MANTRYGALLAANQIRKRQKSQNPYGITEVTRSKPKSGITEVTSSKPRTLRETLAMTGAGRRKRNGTR